MQTLVELQFLARQTKAMLDTRYFSLLAAHLLDLLEEMEVDPEKADVVMNWVAQGRDPVVEDLDY
jgi:hypothetical protein